MAESAQDELLLLLTLGTIGVLALALFIILFFFIYQKRILVLQQQKQRLEIDFQEQMSNAQLDAQEKDRIRIAADLHDSVGSLLWAAKLNASFIERSVPLTNPARESHDELIKILDQSIQTVRRIAWQLTPEAFQHAGLVASLERLCNTIDGRGITVSFESHHSSLWNDGNALQTFRIVQELLSNSIRHSGATKILVSLFCPGNTMFVVVEDDGVGYQPQLTTDGVGWWSIRQRARQIGAELSIGQPPSGKGLSVTVAIPLKP
ncbi:MAG: hypothetical protein JNL40_09725 [Cyclobacteriaceae bacterium]|nr:hypothetical protein [Cyclobacteriaceae bacterium]